MTRCNRALLVGLFGLMVAAPAAAQSPAPTSDTAAAKRQLPVVAPPSTPRVRVYLDCFDCFPQYLRDQITFVDFVRQPQDADVQLLSRSSETGGGGREIVLRFIGRGRFAGHDHEHRVTTLVSDTENTRRELILRSVIVALLDYAVRDGLPPGVSVAISTEHREDQIAPTVDPWNLWVFSLRANGSMNLDQQSRERTWRFDYSADRVTEDWKMSVGGRINQNHQHFILDDGSTVDVTRRDRNVNGSVVKSLGPHWSAGARGRISASTFNNYALSVSAAPAIEYNVFPYDEYATRQLRLQYDIGVNRVRYNEITIYDKLREVLWQQELSATLDQRQPWGSIRASAQFSQYLHDLSKYSLEGFGNVSLRLTRGFSLNFSGSASRIRDQLSLPLRDATDEEVLLRIRQLGSTYQVRFSFGLTYTFGSIFNNIVNPRFGQ